MYIYIFVLIQVVVSSTAFDAGLDRFSVGDNKTQLACRPNIKPGKHIWYKPSQS